jgi:GNAT superfamily N-acetyltransferase
MGPVTVRRVRADEWEALREVRLAALEDAPEAFASTLEEESAFADSVWRDRASQGSSNATSATFVAADAVGSEWLGLAGGFASEDGAEVDLFSMWVRHAARRRGVAVLLIDAVVKWSLDVGARTVGLWVAEGNPAAAELYRRCGFTPTGVTGPFPNHPGVTEVRLARAL